MIVHRALRLLAVAVPLTTASTASAQWQTTPPQPAPSPAAAPPPSAYDPSMQAGGLAPPAPMQGPPTPAPAPAPATASQELDEAKEQDAGRGLEFFWVNVQGGFEHVGLSTFNVDEKNLTAGFIPTTATGGVVDAGLGLRLLFFTAGARGRVGFFGDWQLFTLGGEVGIHIPLGRLDPHFDLGFGYAGLGSFDSAVRGAADAIAIRGFYGRVSGGLDIYLTPTFSLGANATADFLGLTRPGLSAESVERIKNDPATDPVQTRADLLATEGTSYGAAFALTAVAGLHF